MREAKPRKPSAEGGVTRRKFLSRVGRGVGLVVIGAPAAVLAARAVREDYVWQIDPNKCLQCGNCQTNCVREQSAVRCVHVYAQCGYCEPCFGYFRTEAARHHEGGENQRCPVGALKRSFVEEPYFNYDVDQSRCIACGKCVKGCVQFGNGSLQLQIIHDLCLHCNQCSIALVCEGKAFVRIPRSQAYLQRKSE